MSITVQCTCGQKLSAKDKHSGAVFNCPKCGKPVTIPSKSPEDNVFDKPMDGPRRSQADDEIYELRDLEVGQLYKDANKLHYVKLDRGKAVVMYRDLIEKFPESKEAQKSRLQLENIAEKVQRDGEEYLNPQAARSLRPREGVQRSLARDASKAVNVSILATTMTIIGWLGVFVGCLTVLIEINQELWTIPVVGVSAALSGFIIVGFGSVIDYLAKIEGHLQKQGDGVVTPPTE